MRTLRGDRRAAILRKVVRLPGALPVLLHRRCGSPSSAAVIAAIVSEYFGGLQNGLGRRPSPRPRRRRPTPRAWAIVTCRDRARRSSFYLAGGARRARWRCPGNDHKENSREQVPYARAAWAAALAACVLAHGGLRAAATTSSASTVDRRRRRQAADQGQAAAAVVHPGAVRRATSRRCEKGFYKDAGLDVQILEGGTDIVPADRSSPRARPTSPSPGCPRRCSRASRAPSITDIAQVFQRSGTLQVSFKDKNITDAGRPQGQEGRQLGLRQRVRALRRA